MDGELIFIAVFAATALVGIWLGLRESRQVADVFEALAARRDGRVVKHLASHPELRLDHGGRPVLVTATVSSSGPHGHSAAATLVRAWLDADSSSRFEVQTRSLGSKLDGLLARKLKPVDFGESFAHDLDARAEDPDLLRRALDERGRRSLRELNRRWPGGLTLRLGPVRPRPCDLTDSPEAGEPAVFLDERPALTLSVERVLTKRADYERLIEPFLSILDRLVGSHV